MTLGASSDNYAGIEHSLLVWHDVSVALRSVILWTNQALGFRCLPFDYSCSLECPSGCGPLSPTICLSSLCCSLVSMSSYSLNRTLTLFLSLHSCGVWILCTSTLRTVPSKFPCACGFAFFGRFLFVVAIAPVVCACVLRSNWFELSPHFLVITWPYFNQFFYFLN